MTRTGPQSTMGQLATMLGGIETGQTPLERRLGVFGNQVAIAIPMVGLALTMGGLVVEGPGRLGQVCPVLRRLGCGGDAGGATGRSDADPGDGC